MAVEAPTSKYKKNNLIIWIAVLVVLSGWCIYDGYFNQKWIDEHTNEDGSPQAYLVFNQRAPFVLLPIAALLGGYFFLVKDRKIYADENKLQLGDVQINYNDILKIDKTNFDSKGYFIITYTDVPDHQQDVKIKDKNYDNLDSLLEHLISKIS